MTIQLWVPGSSRLKTESRKANSNPASAILRKSLKGDRVSVSHSFKQQQCQIMKKRPEDNKFHQGNGDDGKHYWLTPPDLMEELQSKFQFDHDACPFPKPDDYDGLTAEWGNTTYVNPPFGSIIHNGKKKGPTAWMRKAIEEYKKGKKVVVVYPIDKWILMMIQAGAEITNLGDVKWCATEDGSQGKGTGRHIAQFVLNPKKEK